MFSVNGADFLTADVTLIMPDWVVMGGGCGVLFLAVEWIGRGMG